MANKPVKSVRMKGKIKQPTLPPGVEIWPDGAADLSDPRGGFWYMLVDRLPFTPSRFVLKRGYPSHEAALAEAWEVMMQHQPHRTYESLSSMRVADRVAEQRIHQRLAKKTRKEAAST